MPLDLTPLSDGTETLTPLTEGAEALAVMAEDVLDLVALAVLAVSTRLGFFPDTALYSAPYPYPSSTSYPGDTITTGLSDTAPMAEDATLTLTPLTED